MSCSVIIVAGGSGSRMGVDLPKQFLELKGKPVLMHTIERFYNYNNNLHIVLVLPQAYIDYWNSLIKEYNFTIKHTVTNGGTTRFNSVKNGLDMISNDSDMIAVHDGARPLVSDKTIDNCFIMAEEKGAAIPVIDVDDSLRMVTGNGSEHVDRGNYKRVQTPQIFSADVIVKAYDMGYDSKFTDDASVVEAAGHKIWLADGNIENIKITHKTDMIIAEAIIDNVI
ncbi:MAG: 2-C-methyl-D-erythritol 4-phosphate cytidylyltransferase [Bacteroidales bacterium]|jgi:2-C-methyl-D-erythritol 4-phosphate cytidylyltransferase|nr:2-C-methyl-D-erythritol 4-phosphate cytidylyltransferase [Bacteroidales bacterium]